MGSDEEELSSEEDGGFSPLKEPVVRGKLGRLLQRSSRKLSYEEESPERASELCVIDVGDSDSD